MNILRLFKPKKKKNITRLKINGYPAELQIWTETEFKKLTTKPSNALKTGCYQAELRML